MKAPILSKSGLIVLATSVCSLYLLAFYFNCRIHDILLFRKFAPAGQRVGNGTKKILFWNTMFGDELFFFGRGDIFNDCPVKDCYATHDRGYADVEEFDAILFHGNELLERDLPSKRSSRQWYVFVNLESPVNRPYPGHIYEDYFNLTMTYRLNSDLAWTYGRIKDSSTDRVVAPLPNTSWNALYNYSGDGAGEDRTDEPLWRTIRGKTEPVIWFVSNCRAGSGRHAYVNELSKHISVDVYGKCGSHRCPRSEDCFTEIAEPRYFFYLSFENSLCEDYVTEKLYNALSYDVVPVVYGGANYSNFAPPRSYIDTLNFDTPELLAEHLNWLMKHPHEYSKYFEWKKHYRIDKSSRPTACKLCEFLHEKREPRTRNALSEWYNRWDNCPLHELLGQHAYVTGDMLKN